MPASRSLRHRAGRRTPRKTVSERRLGSRTRLGALIIVLTGVIAYSNSLSHPFVFDDQLSIVENASIREWWSARVLSPERELPTAGRPLVNFSFAVTYALAGLDVRAYHTGNLAIHIACALLIFAIIRRTLQLPTLGPAFAGQAANLALATALLWISHPLNTEAVDYLTQRTELMMALFFLLTLYAATRAWESPRGAGWQAGAVVSCALGMACKESMATAPFIVALFDRIFLFGSLREALRARWRLYAGLAATWLLLAALIRSGPRIHSAGFSTGVSPWTYLLNQTVMIVRYIGLAIWPRSLVLNYGSPIALVPSAVVPYAAMIAALLLLTIVALIRWPKLGFLGAFFFITLAPASSIVPIATEVGAERRMYLPLIALVTLGVVAAARAAGLITPTGAERTEPSQARQLSRVATATLVMVLVAFTVGTFRRNSEYTSSLTLARTVVDRYPTSVGHHLLGAELSISGNHEEAISELRRALPGAPRAHYTLGIELFNQGKFEEAIDELTTFVHQEPLLLEAVSAQQIIGQAFAREHRWSQAVEHYRAALAMAPTNITLRQLLAEALFADEKFDEAIVEYSAYLKSRPHDVGALTQLGVASVATGKLEGAIAAFRQAVAIDPRNPDAQQNLANALFDHQDFKEAALHAEQLLALRPSDPVAREVLAQARARASRREP